MPKGIYKRKSLEERFWSRVNKTDTCWLWTGHLASDGYGQIYNGKSSVYVHRLSLSFIGKTIPKGMEVDHLCRVKNCLNPEHLEVVTRKENILRGEGAAAKCARKTHCVRGHELNADNIYPGKTYRQCKVCVGIRNKKHATAIRNKSV